MPPMSSTTRCPLAARLCGTRAAQDLQLRFLPWRPLCEHVFLRGSRAGVPALTTAAELRDYLRSWSAGSSLVRDTLRWRYTPGAMRDICRLGAWLGDLVNTELCVRARTHVPWVNYVEVSHSLYTALGRMIGLDNDICLALYPGARNLDYVFEHLVPSAGNLGYIFEHLMWLALEEDRCEWILGVLRCLPIEYVTLYFSELAGQIHGPMQFAADELVEQVQQWLEQEACRSRCVDEETKKRLAHAQISTSSGDVLETCRHLYEYAVSNNETLSVILMRADADFRETA